MPKGIYEDNEKNRKLGLVGKSKNKWNAKGELRPARKSRAKDPDRFKKALEEDIGEMPDVKGDEKLDFASQRRPEYLTKKGEVRKRAPRMKKDKRSTEPLPESIEVQVENILQPSTNAFTAVMGGQGFEESSNVAQNQALDFLNFINATMPEPTAEGQQNITMAIQEAEGGTEGSAMTLDEAMAWLKENDKKKWLEFSTKEQKLESRKDDATATLDNILEDRDAQGGYGVDRRHKPQRYYERDKEIDEINLAPIISHYRFTDWFNSDQQEWRRDNEGIEIDLKAEQAKEDQSPEMREMVKRFARDKRESMYDWDSKWFFSTLGKVNKEQRGRDVVGEDTEGKAKRKLRKAKYAERDFTKKVIAFTEASIKAKAGATSGVAPAKRTNYYFGTEDEEIRAGDTDPSLYASADPAKENQRVGGLGGLDLEQLEKERMSKELDKKLASVPESQRPYWKEYYEKNPSLLKKVAGRGREKFINNRSLGVPLEVDVIDEPKTKMFREQETHETHMVEGHNVWVPNSRRRTFIGEATGSTKWVPREIKSIQRTKTEELTGAEQEDLFGRQFTQKEIDFGVPETLGYEAPKGNKIVEPEWDNPYRGRTFEPGKDKVSVLTYKKSIGEGGTGSYAKTGGMYSDKHEGGWRGLYDHALGISPREIPSQEGAGKGYFTGGRKLGEERPVMRPVVPKIGVMEEAPWGKADEPVEPAVKPAEKLKKIIKRKKKFKIVNPLPPDPDPDETPAQDVPTTTIEQITEAVEPQDINSLFSEQTSGWLKGFASSAKQSKFKTLEEAQVACIANPNCGGITYQGKINPYSIRKGTNINPATGKGEVSWLKKV